MSRRPRPHARATVLLAAFLACCKGAEPTDAGPALPKADGYRGIWYSNQPSNDRFRFKYSGGLGTYPQQLIPFAYYSAEAEKTFFTYGGASDDGSLLHMVSYYDHRSGRVPRPRILLDKATTDAHDNPTIMLDDAGYLWIFSSAHGTARPSYIHRSIAPYSIDAFELVRTANFSYAQPWYVRGVGFCFLQTRYEGGGRSLYVERSPDGRRWSEPRKLARVERGHYQISARSGRRIGTAFNVHPAEGGLNARTNLYYAESDDGGATWRAADGTSLELPLTALQNPALALDYLAAGQLVYLKDLQFGQDGRPIVLFLTSRGYASGPANDPRVWHTARFDGVEWIVRSAFTSDHNYDFGSLWVEPDGRWRVIAPTEPGPQRWGTGGEIAVWVSDDRGESWLQLRVSTAGSERNHTYVRRPVDAHPDFYAFWADGNAFEPSESALYFANRDGDRVYRLPARMTAPTAAPERVR